MGIRFSDISTRWGEPGHSLSIQFSLYCRKHSDDVTPRLQLYSSRSSYWIFVLFYTWNMVVVITPPLLHTCCPPLERIRIRRLPLVRFFKRSSSWWCQYQSCPDDAGFKNHITDWKDEDAIRVYLSNVLNKNAFDHSGLIYGMGHAVYSLSDPRAEILKDFAKTVSKEKRRTNELIYMKQYPDLLPRLFRMKERYLKV